eukprot:GHRR01013068.1.p2 GENE.GHRR01013068.1~~GHRR01013068.1.p2  ORF type:complete len:155 (+),score=39.31 GHRR01013068.1:1043-1507(+)
MQADVATASKQCLPGWLVFVTCRSAHHCLAAAQLLIPLLCSCQGPVQSHQIAAIPGNTEIYKLTPTTLTLAFTTSTGASSPIAAAKLLITAVPLPLTCPITPSTPAAPASFASTSCMGWIIQSRASTGTPLAACGEWQVDSERSTDVAQQKQHK